MIKMLNTALYDLMFSITLPHGILQSLNLSTPVKQAVRVCGLSCYTLEYPREEGRDERVATVSH